MVTNYVHTTRLASPLPHTAPANFPSMTGLRLYDKTVRDVLVFPFFKSPPGSVLDRREENRIQILKKLNAFPSAGKRWLSFLPLATLCDVA